MLPVTIATPSPAPPPRLHRHAVGRTHTLVSVTVQVKVSILDRDPRILPEMGAKVDFLETTPPRSGTAAAATPVVRRISVPANAVREEDGKSVVYLVQGGRLARREVQAAPVSGDRREIRSGLSGGEQLLVGGVDAPREGMRVKIGS